MRKMRLYRLSVEYPDAAYDKWGLDPDWEPDDWFKLIPEGWHGDRFVWPKEKIYFSKSGAEDRADLFRKYGATVTVEASDPVTWSAPATAIEGVL